MTSVMSIALSGLNAASTKVGTAANNIANARTTGAIDPADGPEAYTPKDVVQTTLTSENGTQHGTQSNITDRNPATDVAYEPDSQYANEEGLVATPNVDYVREIVDINVAVNAYKANAAVIKVDNEMSKALMGMFDETA